MSWQPDNDPEPGNPRSCDAIEQVIVPRARDLGGFDVRRALPAAGKQMVGPFIFFDQMGPAEFLIGAGHRRAPASRTSGSRPSPICSTARSCIATASAPRCRSSRAS